MDLLLDRYEVLGQLGSGGLAEVLRVRDRTLPGRVVALKQQHAHVPGDALLEEFLALIRVQHPNLPRVYDFHPGQGDQSPAYTLQEIVGQTADRAVEGRPPEFVGDLAAGLLRALAHIHSRGLTHGDIHPHNIIVSPSGHATLLDLSPASPRTSPMAALPYLAPERLEGGQPSVATDLFAAGVTLFRLVTGHLPFPDYPHLPDNGLPLNPSTLGPFADAILPLLAPRPENRPVRADDVLARIARGLDRPLHLLTPEVIRATLQNGPTLSIGDWPGQLIESARGSLQAGRATAILVTGALGSGRSRALQDLTWALQAKSLARVAHAAAGATDSSGRVLARLYSQLPKSARSALPAALRIQVDALLGGTLLSPDATFEQEKATNLAIDGLARAFCWLARRHALAILVDDIERLPDLDRRVLEATTRAITLRPDESGSLLLVLAGLPGDATAAQQDAGAVLNLSPPPFEEPSLSAYLETTFQGRPPTRRLAQCLTRLSGGNPLIAGQAVAAAFERGWLQVNHADVDLASEAPLPLPVPTTAAEALLERLEQLPKAAWPLVAIAAEVAMPVPVGLAATILGSDDRRAAEVLTACCDLEIVQLEVGEHETRACLTTPTLRDAIRQRVRPDRAALTRLVSLPPNGLSLAGRVLAAEAALILGAGQHRGREIADELLQIGLPTEALAVLQRVTHGVAKPLGDAHAMLGHATRAQAAYEQLPKAEADEHIGVLFIRLGRYREAVDRLQPRLESLATDTLAWLARAHMMLGEYDAALEACARARETADGSLLPRLQYIEGLVHFYRGEYPVAATAFETARTQWQAQGRLVELANVVNAIGLVHFRQAELGPALDRFDETLKLTARSGDRERALLTLMNVAVIHQERGEYELAESRYREALDMARLLRHRAGQMKVAQNLGNLYRYLGALDDAEPLLLESLRMALEDQNHYLASHNRTLLGEMAWLRGRNAEAEATLTEALRGFEEVGSVNEAADCERSLAEVLLSRGDLTAAKERASRAQATADQRAIPRLQTLARLTLAEVALRQPVARLGDAEATVNEALRLLGDSARPALRWQALRMRHRVQKAQAKAPEALKTGIEAAATLHSLAAGLPEKRRAAFLAVRDRREAVYELEWLRSLRPGDSEQRSHAMGDRLGRLLEVNQRLNDELDLSRLLEYIIDSAILLTGAERGFLLMREKPDAPLRVVIARNIDQENIRNKKYKVSYSIAEQVVEAGEPVLTTDAMADDRYSEFLSINHLKLRSLLCLPMIRRGRVLGALYVDNRFQKNAFTSQDLAFMDAFANQAAIALTNARILEERQKAADALATSQAKVEELNARLRERLAAKERALKESEQLLLVQRRQLKKSYGYDSIIGNSQALRQVFHVLDRVCQSHISVLVTGESGTGKELVARAVHFNGPRKDRPFVAINCSSIPETLIESELFGHVRGAFTGATADKKGVFEVAHRGTLFLDEIGEMPVEMQAKLLRAVQEGEIQKVGSPRTSRVDVRIIAATNRNLRERVQGKAFREDLYYRLAVVTIELPPLRDRRDDIPILVAHFLEENRQSGLGQVTAVSPEAMRLLARYAWPGNVRELQTVIKNASLFAEAETLQPIDFQNFPSIVGHEPDLHGAPSTQVVRPLAELERDAIMHALEANSGNKKRTAELLGIDRRTLYNKLAVYGISVERRTHVLGRDSDR